ncbi:MAG TPA: adenine deaminase [Thermoanaerobaculia bacterium]|nr:adenine deaminase [Thermoanaerobaculia bacterium]
MSSGRRLAPFDDALPALLAVARGDRPADLVIRGGRVVNLFTGEVAEAEVAVAGGRIAAVGHGLEGRATVEAGGGFLVPGLIDAHVHIESSLVTPRQFARAVVPRGVTTVVTDPHEIANVCGLDGIRFMIADAAAVPLEVLVNASSCVPASPLATSGARLEAADLARLLDDPAVLGLAEVMNFPGVVAGDPAVLAKLAAFRGRPLDGHAPGLSGRRLDAYAAAGISSDHESTTAEEAREKLRRGLTVFLRQATNAKNLLDLLPVVDRWTERRICLCTDDRVPGDLLDEGSVDHLVRMATGAGVEPLAALRMASLNTAEHFALGDRGAIVPGRRADLVLVADLADFRAEVVWIAGEKVAEGGEASFDESDGEAADGAWNSAVRDTVHLPSVGFDFAITAAGDTLRVIGLVPDQLVTDHLELAARIEDGRAVADPERDLAKIAVVERHGTAASAGGGRTGLAFVHGLGLARGALAGTFAHDHHNLVAIGIDDRSMATAARAVAERGGGLAAAEGDRLLALLPLPIAGLMSDRPIGEVRRELDELLAAAHRLGSPLHDPFMAMSFLTLEVIPSLKLTDQGLVDVDRFERVPLFVER